MSALLELVDGAVSDRVVVFGSLPPAGRDLDLLARPGEQAAIEAELGRAGFMHRGALWARFRDCGAEVVEVVPAEDWGLSAGELEALYAEAEPLAGRRNLVAPSPPHTLLIAARKLARAAAELPDSMRTRIERATDSDTEAWSKAAGRAPRWEAEARLQRLRKLAEGRGGARLAVRAASALRHVRRGCVISLSGLDGAGKSSQAKALQQALEQLGYEVVVRWTPFGLTPTLWRLTRPLRRRMARDENVPPEQVSLVAKPDQGPAQSWLRSTVVHVWTTVAAVVNGSAHLRASLPALVGGKVVVFDRHCLDSAVQLRYRYGEERRFRFQNAVIGVLSPKPRRAYFLDVEPETVVARKPIQYELEHVRRQARLYRGEHARRRVRRLDGERPREELCAEIAADVWSALRG